MRGQATAVADPRARTFGMIQTIVITGGPCAGKTSAVAHVERTFAGRVATVPHVAGHVQQVFPRPICRLTSAPNWS